MSFTFKSCVRSSRILEWRCWKALFVGAKRVNPSEVELSWLWILVSSWNSLRKLIRVVYSLPFFWISVRFTELEGAGVEASVWAWVWEMMRKRKGTRMRGRGFEAMFVE